MIKKIQMASFGIWMYACLLSLWPNYNRIKKYKTAGAVASEIEEIQQLQKRWGSLVLSHFGVKLRIKGLENIPDGPVLFAANHQSYADIPIFVAAIDRQAGFVAKAELARLPIYGKFIKAVRSVFISRRDARAALRAFDEGAKLLEQGFSLGIFPEGTRSKGPEMQVFKKGSLKLAIKTGVPIVPVVISGSYKTFEEKGVPAPAVVDFIVLPAIQTKTLSKEELNRITETLEHMIRSKLTELQKPQHKNAEVRCDLDQIALD